MFTLILIGIIVVIFIISVILSVSHSRKDRNEKDIEDAYKEAWRKVSGDSKDRTL